MNVVTGVLEKGNSGIDAGTGSHGILATISKNHGVTGGIHNKSQKVVTISKENKTLENSNDTDINEIIFTDPKRKRVAHENNSPDEDMVSSLHEEEMEESNQDVQLEQKNLYLAGTASQSRHSS